LNVTRNFRSEQQAIMIMRKMTHLPALVVVLLLTASAIVAALVWRKSGSEDLDSAPVAAKEARSDSLINRLNDERIVAIHQWQIESDEEKTLICMFRAFDKDPNYEGSGVKLTILDPSGATVYEARFGEVQRVYSTFALRDLSEQLIIEMSYGGSTSFLHMLDYRNGKVVELINEKESDFDAGAEVRAQFRTGINPATEPFQIMLTRGVGLASPARKYTTVYRYKDGRFQRVGEFVQQEADDYMEDRLTGKGRRSKAK